MFPASLGALVIASVTAATVAQAEGTASFGSTAGFVSCVGDGDDVVGISELITLVNLALGLPGDCPSGLLPAGDRYYAYSGSLTTPPKTERVEWRVMIEPIGLSAADIAAIRAEITSSHTVGPDGNNRPTQPINSREVLLDIS